MTQEPIFTSINGHIGTITFNRPDKGNALSPEMLVHIHRILSKWSEEDAVRCVVISGGTGKAFSSGYDITAIPTRVDPEMEQVLREHNPLELAFKSIKTFPYPTIAMINGYCFGAGLNLAMICDIRIATDTVKVGMPPARLGLVYHAEGLVEFVQAIGMAATRELFFTARTYMAAEARDIGLMNHVIPKETLVDFTDAMAGEIAENAPISLKNTKAILAMIDENMMISPENKEKADRLQAQGFVSDDLKEGQMAFLEKRKPVFTGK